MSGGDKKTVELGYSQGIPYSTLQIVARRVTISTWYRQEAGRRFKITHDNTTRTLVVEWSFPLEFQRTNPFRPGVEFSAATFALL